MNRGVLWPARLIKPPCGQVEIDWGHPYTQRLAGCWLMDGLPLYDRALGQKQTAVTGAPTFSSRGLVFNGSTHLVVNRKAGPATSTSAWSCFAYGIRTVAARTAAINYGEVTDSNYAFTFGVDADNIVGLGANGVVFTTGSGEAVKSSLTAPLNTPVGMGVSQTSATSRIFVVNGVSQTDTSTLSGGASTAGLAIGTGYQNSAPCESPWTGTLSLILSWSYAVPSSVLCALSVDPYCFLRPVVRRSYVFFSTTAGGLSTRIAMYHYLHH